MAIPKAAAKIAGTKRLTLRDLEVIAVIFFSLPSHPTACFHFTCLAGLLARGSMPLPAFPDQTGVKWQCGRRLSAYSRGGGFRFGGLTPYEIPCSVPRHTRRLREHQAIVMSHFALIKASGIHDI